MKLTHRLLSLILIFAMLLTITVGCGEDTDGVGEPEPEKQPVILRVYIDNGSITFGQEHLKDGIVPLPGGLTAEADIPAEKSGNCSGGNQRKTPSCRYAGFFSPQPFPYHLEK